MNRSITKQQRLLVRGGWPAADMSDKAAYRAVNPAMTYPPMLALGGHPDPRARVYPMRLPFREADADLSRKLRLFVDKLYLNNIEKFVELPNVLPMLIQTCASAGIMYHVSVYSEHGPGNSIVAEKMIDRVLSCELAQDRQSAHQLLCTWGDMIQQDFKDRNKKQIQHGDKQNLVQVNKPTINTDTGVTEAAT